MKTPELIQKRKEERRKQIYQDREKRKLGGDNTKKSFLDWSAVDKIKIKSFHGIGDTIYIRPFIKEINNMGIDVYMDTSIPQLFKDLKHVKLIKPDILWRTQSNNISNNSNDISWYQGEIPTFSRGTIIDPLYGSEDLIKSSVISSFEEKMNISFDKLEMDYPETLNRHGIQIPKGKKLAIIRPVTIRAEWECSSRAPLPNYISWCSKVLMNSGYYVISIADIERNEEWLLEPSPEAHLYLYNRELTIEQTLSLIQDADIVVGGSGFIVPAAIAAKVPLFIIFGGRGGFDAPWKILDLRMDLTRVGWALPDNFCRCTNMKHDCNKTISDIDRQFFDFMARIELLNKIEKKV